MQDIDKPMARTTITIPADLLADAKAFEINLSRHVQRTLNREIARMKADSWLERNKAGIAEYNEFVRKHGVLTESLRTF